MDGQRLHEGLALLGQILADQSQEFELVVIGDGALLLKDLIDRPTEDLDAVALMRGKRMISAKPLPAPLLAAVQLVAETLDLAREDCDGKDWLNGAPSMLLQVGLPTGFQDRLEMLSFGSLTVHLPSRQDLVTLKLLAATNFQRGDRARVDIGDLKSRKPTRSELRTAVRWVVATDGRKDFLDLDMIPAVEQLGVSREEARAMMGS